MEGCHCLEFVVTKAGAHFQCTFSASCLLPKIRANRSQLPVSLSFISAAMLLHHDIEGLSSLYIFKCQVNNYSNNLPLSCCYIFICHFINLHFKCYLPSQFPLCSLYLQHLLLWVLPQVPQPPNIPLPWVIKIPQDYEAPLLVMTNKALLCFTWRWRHGSPMCMHSLVGVLAPGVLLRTKKGDWEKKWMRRGSLN